MQVEHIAALRRAFIEKRADYIDIDGWCPRWQFEAVAEAERLGWLTSERLVGDQYTVDRYRPTKAGLDALAGEESADG